MRSMYIDLKQLLQVYTTKLIQQTIWHFVYFYYYCLANNYIFFISLIAGTINAVSVIVY